MQRRQRAAEVSKGRGALWQGLGQSPNCTAGATKIGIRKISGATTAEIIMMLCRQYVPLVLLSFVLAAPLAFYFYQRTMEPFSQHAETNWWMFPLSFVLVGGITLATVVLKSWNTACEDPSESLNSE